MLIGKSLCDQNSDAARAVTNGQKIKNFKK